MGFTKEIGLTTIVTQEAGLVAADMDGEKVMLNIKNGKYFGLDTIGSSIWEIIEIPRTIGEVVSLLQKKYDVEEKICERDTIAFLCTLHAKGLAQVG